MNLRHLSAAVLLWCCLAPSVGWAQVRPSDSDVATARQLTLDGYAALEQRDFARAESRFARAESIFHAPTVSLGLARARAGLGKLVGAQEAYSRIVHTTLSADASPAFIKAVEDARSELGALTPRVPSLIIEVNGSAAPRVTVDDAELPTAALGVLRPLDPGRHVVRATAPGFAVSEATVTLVEGRTERVTLELKPGGSGTLVVPPPPRVVAGNDAPPPPPASSLRPIGYAGVAAGGAGLVVGAVTGVIGLMKQSDLLKHCPGGACPSDPVSIATYQGEVNTYQAMKIASTTGLVVGGALAVTGIVLIVTAPQARAQAAVLTPVIGPGYLGVDGTF
jgi:hypothetical protein